MNDDSNNSIDNAINDIIFKNDNENIISTDETNNINNNMVTDPMTYEEPTSFDEGVSFTKERKPFPTKIVLIGFGALLLLGLLTVLVIYLIGNKVNYLDQESALVVASRSYYNDTTTTAPLVGTCETITLKTLLDSNKIENKKLFKKCDEEQTYIKKCQVQEDLAQYTPILSCKNYKSLDKFSNWQEGSATDLITDKSDVKFEFMGERVTSDSDLANVKEEEIWKDEITYNEGSYKIMSEQTYYRSRVKVTKWYTEKDIYYPKDESNKARVSQYYLTAPTSAYNKKGDSSSNASRWYLNAHTGYTEPTSESPNDMYTVKGEPASDLVRASISRPLEKSYRTILNTTIYRTRDITSTKNLTKTDYWCGTATDYMITNTPCNQDPDAVEAGLTNVYQRKCYYEGTTPGGWQTAACNNALYTYSAWKEYQPTACSITTAEPITCQSTQGYRYTDKRWTWYTPSTRTYYSVSGKAEYYVNSPVAQAVRDTSTTTTAYKWYKTTRTDLGYYASSPKAGAKQVANSEKWSDWSGYITNKIASSSSKEVEERVKVKLKQYPVTNITDTYVSESVLIQKIKDAGYNVNSLEDINNTPEIKYSFKMFYRNK